MKIPYTFSVLRYRHDIVSGEFVNVGVVVYAPHLDFFDIKCLRTLGRVSRFFRGTKSDHLRQILHHISDEIKEDWGNGYGNNWPENIELDFNIAHDPKKVRTGTKGFLMRLNEILPIDDSALQFSPPRGGITTDPRVILEELYERYVERYTRSHIVRSRSDDEVKQTFHNALAERRLLRCVRPERIKGVNYEHEFPYSWRNGILNASEAVSFDLVESRSILDKANRWLGRAINLSESVEEFKLYLLLGEPRSEQLQQAFTKAENILNKMPCPHDFIREKDADSFAEHVQTELEH